MFNVRVMTVPVLTLVALVTILPAQADELVMESRESGDGGGGNLVSGGQFVAHSIRVLERTEITSLGANIGPASGGSMFAALHQLSTPNTIPDVAGDSSLLAVATIDLDGNDEENALSGPVSLIVEPGWYALSTGSERYGTSLGGRVVLVPDQGTPDGSNTNSALGTYSVNASDNSRTILGSELRHFATGQTLPPADPETRFVFETARPTARWSQGSDLISSTIAYAHRFELTRPVRLQEAGTWLSGGSGSIFAAVVALSGPDADPPSVGGAGFADSVVAQGLISGIAAHDEYRAPFADQPVLEPGHYALVLGSGALGASGSAWMMQVTDQVVVSEGLVSAGGPWFDETQDYRMFVDGEALELVFDPDPANLGTAAVDFGSVAQTVNLTNVSTVERSIHELNLTGPQPGSFRLPTGHDSCSGSQLAAGESCTFLVRFEPETLGLREAVVTLDSDAELAGYELALSGEGIPGEALLELGTDSLAFGETALGSTSEPLALTLTSNGTAALAVDAISPAAGPFERHGGDCPDGAFALEPGASCAIELRFSPDSLGPAEADLAITSDAESSPDTVVLSGIGAGPVFESAPEPGSELDFGEVVAGTDSTRLGLAIGNSQGVGAPPASDLVVVDATVDHPDFGVTINHSGPFAAGNPPQPDAIEVTCSPAAIGELVGTLTIETNDPAGDFAYGLACQGIPEPARIEGSVTSPGYCDESPAALDEAVIEARGIEFSETINSQPDGSYLIELPAAAGPVDLAASADGYLSIEVLGVALSPGEVVVRDFDLRADLGCSELTPSSLSATLIPGQGVDRELQLTNSGAAAATFEFDAVPEWAQVSLADGTLEAGEELLITVGFRTTVDTGPGDYPAELRLLANDGQGEFALDVTLNLTVLEPVDGVHSDRFEVIGQPGVPASEP